MPKLVDAFGVEILPGDCYHRKDWPLQFDHYWQLIEAQPEITQGGYEVPVLRLRQLRLNNASVMNTMTITKDGQGALEGVRRVESCEECPRMFQCAFTGQPKALGVT